MTENNKIEIDEVAIATASIEAVKATNPEILSGQDGNLQVADQDTIKKLAEELSEFEVDDRLNINIDGKSATIFMSFGLLNTLVASYGSSGDASDISRIILSPSDRGAIIQVILERVKDLDMEIEDAFDLMTNDTADEILNWVVKHVVNFMIRAIQNTTTLMDKMEPMT